MMVISAFRRELLALLGEKSGNFAIITAILLPVSIGVVGVGMDVNTMVQNRRTLQNAVDAAALATATAMTNDMSTSDAETMAKSFVSSQMANASSSASSSSANLTTTATITTTTTSSNAKTYDVAISSSYILTMNPLSSAFGWKTVTVAANGKAEASTSSSSGTPLSMYLVLDRSGSMSEYPTYTTTCTGYNPWTRSNYTYTCTQTSTQSKIEALKTAVQTMATQLKTADPKSVYVRMGADSYSAKADTPEPMAWGTANVVSYVNKLVPNTTTDAQGALTAAYNALVSTNKTEATAHAVSNFGRYIVFMTDGEMTSANGNPSSSIDTAVRNQCANIKRDNIVIFSIAFNAPDTGKALLAYCATDTQHYYEATDSVSLVAAFGDIGKQTIKSSTRLTN